MPHDPDPALPILGWREWTRLPGLWSRQIKAKIDTGARTSSLHATEIEIVEGPEGQVVRFQLHPRHRDPSFSVPIEAPLLEERWVRSSNGLTELRPVISTTCRIGAHRLSLELSLTARKMMGFRLLLGREAIRGRFLVDPNHSYLLGPRLRTPRISPRSTTPE